MNPRARERSNDEIFDTQNDDDESKEVVTNKKIK